MYVDIIKKYFPKLDIKTSRLITEGWESDVLVINEDLVFRFPKKNSGYDCVYAKEKIITDYIRKSITTEISSIELYNKKEIYFSVLKFINGENLYKTKLNSVDDFVNFLKEIHSVKNVKKLKKVDIDNLPFHKYRLTLNNFSFNYDVLLNILKEHELEDDFNNCLKVFSDFIYNDEDDVLCHNDLHKGNVIVNNGELNGIIDFGDSIYTNYNIEFISIFKWQEKIIIDIKEKYEEITGRKLNTDFIISVIKLTIYLKMSYKVDDIEKYLKRLELFTELSKFFNGLDNKEKLYTLFNDKLVIRTHK